MTGSVSRAQASRQQASGVTLEDQMTRIVELGGQLASQMMPLIEGPQGQKTGVAGDLGAGKIRVDGLMAVEGEAQSC
jgi:hypothetical protein